MEFTWMHTKELSKPPERYIFLNFKDAIHVPALQCSKFVIRLTQALEGYEELSVVALNIKQVFTTPLQFLNIVIDELGNNNSLTSEQSGTRKFTWCVPLLQKGGGGISVGEYGAFIENYPQQISLKAKDISAVNTFSFTLMDENLVPLTWDGTTDFEFEMLIKADICSK